MKYDAADVLQQYADVIVKAARKFVAMVPYDLRMSRRELQADALSEAQIAVMNGLHLYNPNLSALGSFISTKIYWHFKELQRSNAQRCEREVLFSTFEKCFEKDLEDSNYCAMDYIGGDIAVQQNEELERQREVDSALIAMLPFAHEGEQTLCLQTYLDALDNMESTPVPYVASRLNCSRAHVYGIIHEVMDQMPKRLADEIRELF